MICIYRKLFKHGLTSIFSVFRIPHGDKSSVQGFQFSVLKFCRLQSASFEVSSLLVGKKANFVGVKFSKLLRLVFARGPRDSEKDRCLEFGISKMTRWA